MPFKKGQSGNPNGRPKGTGQLEWCREYVEKEGKAKLISWARSDDAKASMPALMLIYAYGLGKPAQAIEVAGNGGGPLKLEVVIREFGQKV